MEYRTQSISKTIILFVLSVSLLGCSKQYEDILNFDKAPTIAFSKQDLTIRVNDYYNTNNNAGYLNINGINGSDKIAYAKIVDTSGKFTILLDGQNVVNTAIDLSQTRKIFISASRVGIYKLTFNTFDRFGKFTSTPFNVNVVPVIIPNAVMQLNINNPIVNIDASNSTSQNGKIISYTYFIDGIPYTISANTFLKTLTPGTHEIGLIVNDDLGTPSIYVFQTINF